MGPRPTVQEQVDRYTDHQRRRLEVKPGHHRLGAGERPHGALVARADRARRLVRGQPLACALDLRILARTAEAAGHRPRALQRRSPTGLGLAARALPRRRRVSAPRPAGTPATRRARSRGRASPPRRSGRPRELAGTKRPRKVPLRLTRSRLRAHRAVAAALAHAAAPARRSASPGSRGRGRRFPLPARPARGDPLERDHGLHLHGELRRGRRPQLRRSPANRARRRRVRLGAIVAAKFPFASAVMAREARQRRPTSAWTSTGQRGQRRRPPTVSRPVTLVRAPEAHRALPRRDLRPQARCRVPAGPRSPTSRRSSGSWA